MIRPPVEIGSMNLMGALQVNKINGVQDRNGSSQLTRNHQYPSRAKNKTEVKNPRVARPVQNNDYTVNEAAIRKLA